VSPEQQNNQMNAQGKIEQVDLLSANEIKRLTEQIESVRAKMEDIEKGNLPRMQTNP
jgi:hypothetical protein